MSQTNLWAIVPAAGSGQRFSKHELKQYQHIGCKTVLEHTVERLNCLNLKGYVLAIGENDSVARTLPFAAQDKAHFCLGGSERVHSVLNALYMLRTITSDQDYVLVHDAARPCVSQQNLEQLVSHCVQHATSAILATPVRDTLKRAKNATIERTVDRSDLWQAQTPQMAKIGTLILAIETALQQNIKITDEASALETIGERVDIVQGRADNIKITYPDDLELAKLILASQNP